MDANGYITQSEARQALRAIYRDDAESNLRKALMTALADDLKPIADNGRWRPSSLLVVLSVLLCTLLAVFLYFSIGVSR